MSQAKPIKFPRIWQFLVFPAVYSQAFHGYTTPAFPCFKRGLMKSSIGLFFVIFLCAGQMAQAAVVSRAVEYRDGEAVLEGYLAYDDAVKGPRPAVLIVHEWKGLNDYAKGRADQLAALGYVGFAIDMYGKGVFAETHEEAAKLSGAYRNDRHRMRQRAKAAYDVLLRQPEVDTSRVAAMGYCFGGMTVLEMARAGLPLLGAASFHGGLSTPLPAKKGEIRAKLRVFHGDEDPFVTGKEVEEFRAEMRAADVDWQMTLYGGAVHAFTVPSAGNDKSQGAAYHEKADKASWKAFTAFLQEIFAAA